MELYHYSVQLNGSLLSSEGGLQMEQLHVLNPVAYKSQYLDIELW